MANKLYLIIIAFSFTIIFTGYINAQSEIPDNFRGTKEAIARGILDGNSIETNFRNHGEHSRWGDLPWGVWPQGVGGKHLDGFGFLIAAEVFGERIKWGIAESDTTLNPVIFNYRQAGLRISPYTGNIWGWLPVEGFLNQDRIDNTTISKRIIPARSDDNTSWPDSWPDRLNETTDSGWPDSWNGFRGKGLSTGDSEAFYVMDDFSDHEYSFGIETEGPHSPLGVYIPSPSDSTIGGLGLQVEVRHFQFNDVLSKDMLFTQYRITNASEKDLEKVWVATMMDLGLGNEESDDYLNFKPELNLIYAGDSDGIGLPVQGGSGYNLGYIGFLVLELSLPESNDIDEDEDGIIDESKFNGAGQLLVGKAAIDEYLNANYNMQRFSSKHVNLEEFPAYRNERWWTGDEDLDWIAYEDFNKNGIKDANEPIEDDLGRDGLGPNHDNYPGPDEGEGDGIPTQGEPNFGEQDMQEAENRSELTFLDLNTRPHYESGNNLRDDTWMFEKIVSNTIDPGKTDYLNEEGEPFVFSGIGPFMLAANTSSYFTVAMIFAETEEELFNNAKRAQLIHESDYGQSPLLTSAEEQPEDLPNKVSLLQNYPNPFNPSTTIQFQLNKAQQISLKVYDITGRLVSELISSQTYSAGLHTIPFYAKNLSSGIYIYKLEVAGEVFIKKLTLVK